MKAEDFIKLQVGDQFRMRRAEGDQTCKVIETGELEEGEDRWIRISYEVIDGPWLGTVATVQLGLPAAGILGPISPILPIKFE